MPIQSKPHRMLTIRLAHRPRTLNIMQPLFFLLRDKKNQVSSGLAISFNRCFEPRVGDCFAERREVGVGFWVGCLPDVDLVVHEEAGGDLVSGLGGD